MSRGSCPHCASGEIRGSGGDLGNGDEYQDRGCSTCGASAYWLRSEGCSDGDWSAERRFAFEPARVLDSIERELLAQIACAPDDDGPRNVYADHVIAREDPLGTFIAAQLVRAARRRTKPTQVEQRLLERHWTAWLGAASTIVAPYKIELERGFWSSCDALCTEAVACLDAEARRAALQCLSWSTVRRLVIRGPFPFLGELFEGPVQRSLRVLHVDGWAMLDELAVSAGRLAIEELRFERSYGDQPLADDLARFRDLGLRSLRRVIVYGDAAAEHELGPLAVSIIARSRSDEATCFPVAPYGVRLRRR